MKLRFLIAALALTALTACQQLQTASAVITATNALSSATVTQSDLNLAVQAYDLAILEPLNAYRYSDAAHKVPRPYCTISKPWSVTNFCASYDTLARVRPYTQRVENAIRDVQECIDSTCNRMSALTAAFRAAWADADTVRGQITVQLGGVQ